MFSNLTILNPLFFAVVPLYYIVKLVILKRVNSELFSNVKLLDRVYKRGFNFRKIIEFFIVFLIALALSNVAQKDLKEQNSINGYSIALLLDASSSMQEQNRFNIAKEVVSNFLTKRKDDEVALILFANYAYVASPLTYDKASLKKMLKFIKLGVAGTRGTALYEAIYKSEKLFKNSTKEKIVIVLSDGIDSIGNISKDEVLKKVKGSNLRLFTIALGKAGDVDSQFLKELANTTGGKFYLSSSPKDLKEIYKEINSLSKSKVESKKLLKYKFFSNYFLVAALILLAIFATLQSLDKRLLLALFIAIAAAMIVVQDSFNNGSKVSKNRDINIALDVSNFMEAQDIYPTRLKFAKAKILSLLKELKGERVGLYLFANKAYLISPPTTDYKRLEYAIDHLDLKNIKRTKSSLLSIVKAINKDLILVTCGSNNDSYKSLKEYASKHNIKVLIYAIGTKEGGVLKLDSGYLKDSSNSLEVAKLNPNLKSIANSYILANASNEILDLVAKLKEKNSLKSKTLNKPANPYLLLLALIFLLLITTKKGRL